ncbi:unnamed protein product, partial [Urochloa humidicola]
SYSTFSRVLCSIDKAPSNPRSLESSHRRRPGPSCREHAQGGTPVSIAGSTRRGARRASACAGASAAGLRAPGAPGGRALLACLRLGGRAGGRLGGRALAGLPRRLQQASKQRFI